MSAGYGQIMLTGLLRFPCEARQMYTMIVDLFLLRLQSWYKLTTVKNMFLRLWLVLAIVGPQLDGKRATIGLKSKANVARSQNRKIQERLSVKGQPPNQQVRGPFMITTTTWSSQTCKEHPPPPTVQTPASSPDRFKPFHLDLPFY